MEQDLGSIRKQILESLRGQSLIVPDLQLFFKHWPQRINPEEKRLRDDVNRRLEECVILNILPSSAETSKLILTPTACSQKAKGFAI